MRLLPLAAITGLFAAATPAFAQPGVPTSYLSEPPAPAVATTSPVDRITEASESLPSTRVWVNADYLLWWSKAASSPPLIQTVPGAVAATGITQLPLGAATYFPNDGSSMKFGTQNGVRFTAGVNFGPNWGLDASGFVLETKTLNSSLFGDGSINSVGIARPYLQAGTGSAISLYSNLPGQYAGGVTVAADTQFFGGDINARLDWYRLFCDRCDLIAGFRYFGLEEGVVIDDASLFPGNVLNTVNDSFRTRNNYYGAQVGVHSQWFFGRVSADMSLKGGFGNVRQQVSISGSNTFAANGVVDTENGGLYARGANLGEFSRNKFAFAGEINANLGYAITPNIRVRIGYTFYGISSVVRASSMIDPVINDQNIRFVLRPAASNVVAPTFDWSRASAFWVQGINFGVAIGY